MGRVKDQAWDLIEARRAVEDGEGCKVPPDGWWCSREPGHEGPCAARPDNTGKTVAESAAAYRKRKAEKIARYEAALREISSLEIRDVHDGYDEHGNYLWVDCVSADEVSNIIKRAFTP